MLKYLTMPSNKITIFINIYLIEYVGLFDIVTIFGLDNNYDNTELRYLLIVNILNALSPISNEERISAVDLTEHGRGKNIHRDKSDERYQSPSAVRQGAGRRHRG
jgi:hypothetical protein